MADYLTPSYLETDFTTLKAKLITLLQSSDIFKDYNYEGSNLTVLMELVSYLGDLNTFYLNQLAKNIHPETADVYEVVSSLARTQGHEPLGYTSSTVTVQVSAANKIGDQTTSYFKEGDQLYIPSHFTMDSGLTDSDGNNIFYSTTNSFTHTVSAATSACIFNIKMRQGQIDYETYTGEEIVDNQLVLPFYNYDCGTYPYDDADPSVVMLVDGDPWTRVPDFYDEISGLNTLDNVYMLIYDKYQRYCINFSASRNVPSSKAKIEIYLVKSLGSKGAIGANVLTVTPDVSVDDSSLNFVTNITTSTILPVDNVAIVNTMPSAGGSDPQTIDQIKEAARRSIHTQYRNVTAYDYISFMEMRSDVVRANVWGEKEQNPGNTLEYNKVYVSVIPTVWDQNTITTTQVLLPDTFSAPTSGYVLQPSIYDAAYKTSISDYLEPRKMMNIYEQFIVPQLIYFRFDIGIRLKRTYNFVDVKQDVKNKLIYFFDNSFRAFNEVIDFRDIQNFILDTSIKSSSNSFTNVKGVDALVLRDIRVYSYGNTDPSLVYAINSSNLYPQYTMGDLGSITDNILKPIKLGFNQYPVIASNQCVFTLES